jgi:2-polyprenyl-6-methoxyphenol hydroxylase-like FAD-dependent oxidoreductase
MRWQVEDVVTEEFGKRMSRHHLPAEVADAVVDGRVTALTLQDGQSLSVGPDTIIVDAMGANSPLMKAMSRRPGAPSVEDEPSNIGYVTQLFRLRPGLGSLLLPDPVADCAAHLGKAFVTLYEGADGWFSVTLAWDIRNKSTSSLLRDTASVTEFASRSPGVARWIAAAHSIGPSRRYMNPRNRWSLPLLASGSCPDNYIAIGDALTTTAPTLGAGCSWLSTHVRILAESLETGAGWRDRFLEIVTAEQRAFFDLSVATGAPAEIEPPPVKRKRTGAVRVLLSPILDREHHARIRDHIVNGSTL